MKAQSEFEKITRTGHKRERKVRRKPITMGAQETCWQEDIFTQRQCKCLFILDQISVRKNLKITNIALQFWKKVFGISKENRNY